jgi:CRISPR-associated endonuclease/helicase Cas3
MLVTFISECEKKALKRTRRVLDAFANRIGNNTWQTPITEEGLDAIKKLLAEFLFAHLFFGANKCPWQN